jgi:alpha-amylase/alpha-mannosidase (GH57 family)
MSHEPVISVLFLWHQHQPFYKDPLSNRYELPWVRLHATKDYYDMVALLDEFPRIKANFNLVPSLLAQLDDYAAGTAQDPFIEVTLKEAAALTEADRLFLLEHFFMANWDRMIEPYPRYRELLDKRGRRASPEDLKRTQQYFKEQDWRDLQVWFNLVWFDPLWREKDSFIRDLFEKGTNFSEADKRQLVDRQANICGLVASKHRELAERGQIEITATPFYHPILPLLCDTDEAKMAMPRMASPKQRFSHPEDARLQIERALDDHEKRFGRRPRGMWPSEGSVSTAVAGLFAELGVQWVATDEAVLANSMGMGFQRDDLYRPYKLICGDKHLSFFFRDHELSDAIGFVYAGWKPEQAADDFIHRLHRIRDRLKAREGGNLRPHVIPVILDGENCWEYYEKDGLPFLRHLYKRLSEDPLITTVTGQDYLERHSDSVAVLPKLWSGSWINSNFGIWIGHDEDNRAWDFLNRTRQYLTLKLQLQPESATSPAAKAAWEAILIAEGSDWCWWYGDDHSSANDATFDYLFRKHLMNVYTLMGDNPPEDLRLPIKTRRAKDQVQNAVDYINPKIDGKATSYYEWHSAGSYQVEGGVAGTMHRVQNTLKTHYFGFDLHHLYFRFDFVPVPTDPILKTLQIKMVFLNPAALEVTIDLGRAPTLQPHIKVGANPTLKGDAAGSAAFSKVLEIAIPLKALPHPSPGQGFRYQISITANEQELERWPAQAPLELPYPSTDTFAGAWTL